ncbi:hypothetical protein ACFQ4C_01645 [Larkinella insperata]|uniref:Uncharacterized protein n=1 Tax=Larkinella insperata TaxID=332158 RepID=A0ABW3Q1N6_9BACT|nr:hypothetical protein [Larkinella insperata]
MSLKDSKFARIWNLFVHIATQQLKALLEQIVLGNTCIYNSELADKRTTALQKPAWVDAVRYFAVYSGDNVLKAIYDREEAEK